MEQFYFNKGYFLLTENCNLKCVYCFEGHSRCITKYMSKEVAFKGVDFLLSQAIEGNLDKIYITFFGGEPTLCPELMIDIMLYAEEAAKKVSKEVYYNVITNGTIYNYKIEKFLDTWRLKCKNNSINIQFSIDGIPEIQNANRPSKSGVSSAKLVEETIAAYKKYCQKYNVNKKALHIHACVSKESLPKIYDSYLYFTQSLGLEVNFAWIIEDNWDDNDLLIFDKELEKITYHLLKTNAQNFPFKHFTESSGCSAGKSLTCIDTIGDIYPCHRFYFNNPDNREDFVLGNIYEGLLKPKDRERYTTLDYNKISPSPCQICVATNQACKKDICQLANDYAPEFMRIINKYNNLFDLTITNRKQQQEINAIKEKVITLENSLIQLIETLMKERSE